MKKSLPLKVALPLISAALVAGSFLGLTLYFGASTQHFLYELAKRDALNNATILMHVMEAFRGDLHSPENLRKLQRIVENTGALPGIEGIFVINKNLTLLASSGETTAKKELPASVRAAVERLAPTTRHQATSTLSNESELLIIHSVSGGVYDPVSQNQVMAYGVMVFDLSKLKAHGANVFLNAWLAIAACGLTCVSLIYLLVSRRVTNPLQSIMKTVRAVGSSDLHAQAEVYRHDELGEIALALNATIDKLREVTVSKLELERVNTELVTTQLKMVQASKMASLGAMAGGVAHEINNPLGIVLARAAQMREMCEANSLDRETTIKLATKIEQTANRITKIVRSLRWFARDGEADPFVEVPVSEIVAETIELCQERFKIHQITLELAPGFENAILSCRPVQISQVLLNLLNNAHDAVENLPERWVRIENSIDSNTLRILITDSGGGVPPEIAIKIMDPFFTTKEVGKGTGLGLSLSQGIIASHGGTLTLDSSYPNTRFVITLPMPKLTNSNSVTALAA